MKQRTKVLSLCRQIEDEQMEVEHLYRILKTNIVPESGTDDAAYKAEAMKLLTTAQNALEEAGTYIGGIGGKPKEE